MTKTNRKTDTRRTPRHTPAHRAVSTYLKSLEQQGSPSRELQKIEEQMNKVSSAKAKTTDPVRRLKLTQEQIDLRNRKSVAHNSERRRSNAERGFIQHALAFSEANGISFSAWRRMGVPVEVLEAAGIQRASQGRKPKVKVRA